MICIYILPGFFVGLHITCSSYYLCLPTTGGGGKHISGWPTFGVMALWTFKMLISAICLFQLFILKTIWDIFRKLFMNIYIIMRWPAEYKTHNSGMLTFGVMALWTFKIVISTIYPCPLCNLKTILDIFMKLYTNVKLFERTCRTQVP